MCKADITARADQPRHINDAASTCHTTARAHLLSTFYLTWGRNPRTPAQHSVIMTPSPPSTRPVTGAHRHIHLLPYYKPNCIHKQLFYNMLSSKEKGTKSELVPSPVSLSWWSDHNKLYCLKMSATRSRRTPKTSNLFSKILAFIC